MIYRFLIIADTIFATESKVSQERFYPDQVKYIAKKFGENRAEKILAWFDHGTQDTYFSMLEEASKLGHYDGIIGAGNYTIGTNESGMITPECVDQWFMFLEPLADAFPNVPRVLPPGGMDTGYRYEVKKWIRIFKIGSERGCVSEKSVAVFQDLAGPLFQKVSIGPATFVTISTNLIMNVYGHSSKALRDLQSEQEEFLREALENSPERIFLVMHDPSALPSSPTIPNLLYKYRDKVKAIIHGHSHSWVLRYPMFLYPPYFKLCMNFNVVMADAPWGFFGIGKAFKTLEVNEDGSFKFKRHVL